MFTRIALYAGLFFLSLSVTHANEFANLPEVKAITKGQPKDVAEFIARTAECNHFGGEEPYDSQRANELKKAIASAGCEQLSSDESNIRTKYKNNKKALIAIDKAKALPL